eukprot:TRINITY_DN15308_c0_g1_i1.p1 TRINITY_DN15308_c0_g1~~TRINITY_DN15308_c0_g1_i1.p1  ORF type:complete len:122 (-),score=0.72 TRINITY_DN15308_c0_g1_i1:91-456(-)
MDHLYRNHERNQQNKQMEESDDNMSISSLERQSSDASSTSNSASSAYDHYTRNSVSLSDFRRFSRTDDDLFELRLPSMSYTPRGSIVDQSPFLNGDDDDDDNVFNFDSAARPRSVKRKYSQ